MRRNVGIAKKQKLRPCQNHLSQQFAGLCSIFFILCHNTLVTDLFCEYIVLKKNLPVFNIFLFPSVKLNYYELDVIIFSLFRCCVLLTANLSSSSLLIPKP